MAEAFEILAIFSVGNPLHGECEATLASPESMTAAMQEP